MVPVQPRMYGSMVVACLGGWLIFQYALVLVLIALRHLGLTFAVNSLAFAIVFAVSAVPSLVLAVAGGQRLYRWIGGKSALTAYLWLAVMLILAIVSFPWVMTLSVIAN